jgi:hypothetical protein
MMTLGAREVGRRSGAEVQLRPEPVRCRLRIGGLLSSDSHQLELSFTFSAQAIDQRGEREMFAETFLTSRDAATADDVANHFAPALRDAAKRLIATKTAEEWTSGAADEDKAAIVTALRAAAKPVAFACGVDLLPPFDVVAESPTLQREKLEAVQRKLAERRAAGQVEHVQKAAELLKQFQSLRESMPGLSPGQLLERINPADRGSMLQSLLLASAGASTQQLWAVAGTSLINVDPSEASPQPIRSELPTDLGPLRSVQPAELDAKRGLLIGAQTGVMFAEISASSDVKRFRDSGVTSQLGFNSAAVAGDVIWASHSEAGVVAWRASSPDEPLRTIRQPAKNLAVLDEGRVIYSTNGDVFVVSADGEPAQVETSSAAPVVFIGVEGTDVLIVRADGMVERLNAISLELRSSERRSGAVASAALLPWLGSHRLLLATEDGPVCCVGDDDPLVTQYASPHRGLRAIAATAGTVAGLSSDRQRLVLWHTWEAAKPFAEIHVAGLTRHRAADVCFA